MKTHFSIYTLFVVFFLMAFIFITSCDAETDPDTDIPRDPGNEDILDPDMASELLVLENFTKVTGEMPVAPNGDLKINHKDTIYIVKDFPFGARIVVKHESLNEITGFYIGVSNSSYYFDVPKSDEETEPYTSVFYLNFADINDPWIPVNIQPHVNGVPADEFKRFVRIQNLVNIKDAVEERNCLFTQDGQQYNWLWEFTVVEDNTGDIHTAYAPNMYVDLPGFSYGGCCWCNSETEECYSIPAKEDPYCLSANPEYFLVSVEDEFYARHFGALDLFDNGTFEWLTRSESNTFIPEDSDYCENIAAYLNYDNLSVAEGTHDYSPGAENIKFTVTASYDFLDPSLPGYIWNLPNGTFSFTCKNLIISQASSQGITSVVFRKRDTISVEDLWAYFPEYYD